MLVLCSSMLCSPDLDPCSVTTVLVHTCNNEVNGTGGYAQYAILRCCLHAAKRT